MAARTCGSCGRKFKRKPVPRGVWLTGGLIGLAATVWGAAAAIIPNLADPEQNLTRIAKQVAAGPKNSEDSKRMQDEFERSVRHYLQKIAAVPTPEIVKKLQKVLPSTAFEVHSAELPRGLRIVEVDTVLQATDYLIMKSTSGSKVFSLAGLEVFDDARLINESAGPMLVAVGHSGGQPPHHPCIKLYGLLPDGISDESEKLLPPIHGEGTARFAKNGRDIIVDLSIMSLGQLDHLFAPGSQTDDGIVHENLEWKEGHYLPSYEYGSSPLVALYAVARCMRYPELTSGHRQYLGVKGEQLVSENKSQDAGDFLIKRLSYAGDRASYLMSGNVGSFVLDLGRTGSGWTILATRNTSANAAAQQAAGGTSTAQQAAGGTSTAQHATDTPATAQQVAAAPAPVQKGAATPARAQQAFGAPTEHSTRRPVEQASAIGSSTKKVASSPAATPLIQPEPAPARALIVERTFNAPGGSKPVAESQKADPRTVELSSPKKPPGRTEQVAEQKKVEREKSEQKLSVQPRLESEKSGGEIARQKRLESEKAEQKVAEQKRLAEAKGISEQKRANRTKQEVAKVEKGHPGQQKPAASVIIGRGLVTAIGTVNLRSGPSISAKPVNSVTKGASLDIVGKTNGWYKVHHDGQTGYIYAGLVDYKKPDAYTTGTVTKPRIVTDSHRKPLGKPQTGDRVVILGGIENNKYKVQLANGKTGYVDKDSVNVTVDEPQFVP